MNPSVPTDHHRVDLFAAHVLGPVTQIADHTRRAGRVIEVRDRNNKHWIVKTTPRETPFRRERFAYRHWVPRFPDQAPRLRATNAELHTLIVEHLPGEARWTFEHEDHRDAGRLLRRLHDAAPPILSGPTVAQLTAERLELAFRRSTEQILSTQERAFALAAIPELHKRAAGLPRVPCHGDYAGHNWLRGPNGLNLIDFSAARRSTAMSDWTRLFAGAWWGRPRLAAAFFDGYGRDLLEEEAACIRLHMRALTVTHIVAGRRNGQVLIEERGRQRLRALMDGRGPLAQITRRHPLRRQRRRPTAWDR